MKIEKVRIAIAELRRGQAQFENTRFLIEVEAAVGEGETVESVADALTQSAQARVDEYFRAESTDVKELQTTVKKYRRKYGVLE